MKGTFVYDDVPLYGEYILPTHIFEELKISVENEENNKIPYNKTLAGNIENEFEIKKINQITIDYLEDCATDFYLQSSKSDKIKHDQIKLKLHSLWLNKQKKYEFNPIHSHSGDISFVCWIKIPYDLSDELELENCKDSNTKSNSLFEFVLVNCFGAIYGKKLFIDKSWEGKSIFFNSKLRHQVYPFYTSDDYRISISGNFMAIYEQNKPSKKGLQYN